MIAGAVGQDVKELQQVLTEKGLLQGSPSGVFDTSTAQAVTAYRQSQGLSPEPVVDQAPVGQLLERGRDRARRDAEGLGQNAGVGVGLVLGMAIDRLERLAL